MCTQWSSVGLACDATNALLISGGYNADIKVWDFKGRELKFRWEIEVPLIKIVYHPGNGILATAADDMILRLLDATAMQLMRILVGHMDRVTDLCFSGDGKWLLSSSMNGTIIVWDIISSRQLNAMHMDSAVTALSVTGFGYAGNDSCWSQWHLFLGKSDDIFKGY